MNALSPSPWALVTAGAHGLGAAICEYLIDRGYSLIIHYHTSAAGALALQARAHRAGTQVHLLCADLSNSQGRIDFMAEVDDLVRGQSLALLVNNLGVYPSEELLDCPIERFEQVFQLTCTSVFHMTQLALPLLKQAPGGARVINLGDSACDRISAHELATPYHIAKLGVHVLTRSYAQALGPLGIRVNMVSPGFLENSVGTPGAQPFPLQRKGRFEDILGVFTFLLSEQAEYVSGANVAVTGAWNLS